MIIFRVLCGEWIEPLVMTMHVTTPAAVVFYFAVLIIGNFLVSIWRAVKPQLIEVMAWTEVCMGGDNGRSTFLLSLLRSHKFSNARSKEDQFINFRRSELRLFDGRQ